MQYLTFCDPHNAADAVGRSGKTVSSRDVVMSGFYDTIGLYDRPAAGHNDIADAWVATLGIGDLVSATPGSFTRLSLGQQKLVLLCRALVKRPRLLVLDEPTHALSRSSRDRFLTALQAWIEVHFVHPFAVCSQSLWSCLRRATGPRRRLVCDER